MSKSRILGISGYLPEKVETNDELARAYPDWDMDRIAEKTGIRSRHIAAEQETANDMAWVATRRLLDRNLVSIDTIDFLIVCTQTPDHLLPSNACLLQHRLGLPSSVAAFDFSSGCSGYVHGLQMASALVESQAARHVLLVNTDTYSKIVHPRDRTARALFGDGAAATLIGPETDTSPGSIGPFVHGTNGSGAADLIVPAGGFRTRPSAETTRESQDATGCVRTPQNVHMNGQAIFSFTLSTVPAAVSQLLRQAELTVADIDWFVCHQANQFMLQNLAACSRIPEEKMVYHLEHVGNTVSASIPLALEAYLADGRIECGQKIVLTGFGVGLSWGVCLITWG